MRLTWLRRLAMTVSFGLALLLAFAPGTGRGQQAELFALFAFFLLASLPSWGRSSMATYPASLTRAPARLDP